MSIQMQSFEVYKYIGSTFIKAARVVLTVEHGIESLQVVPKAMIEKQQTNRPDFPRQDGY